MRYDVFISYRRKGGTEIARAIKAELERLGYSVFLDFDSIRDGNFSGRISEAIASSDIFLLVLSPDALDLCINENDWVRKEIECAIDKKCHIVPVNPDRRFIEFPSTLPDQLKQSLSYLQISDLMLGQLFQASIEKVIKERILPFLSPAPVVTKLHIKSTEDCEIRSFNKPIGTLQAGQYEIFTLNNGRYIFTFINKKGIKKEIQYETTNKTDDFINVDFKEKHKKRKRKPYIYGGLIIIVLIGIAFYFLLRKNGPSIKFADDQTFFSINDIAFEMVYVEGGNFRMGAIDTIKAEKDEFPVHLVHVPNFMIGKYPITQKQWLSIMDHNPSYYRGDDLPVEGVSWFDAQEFTRKLSLLTGKEFDLPTEAEWEYAARGGNKSRGYKYSGGNEPNNIGWFKDNSAGATHVVGRKAPNELGIYDMSGNVWEWCWDYYGEDYYSNCFDSISSIGPQGMAKAPWRVFRGGSIQLPQNYMRVSNRDSFEPNGRDHDIGFRIKLKL